MMTGDLKLLAMASLLIGCAGADRARDPVETVRVAVGMQVDDLNAQPLIARQPWRLSPRQSGMFGTDEPHVLVLEVNGRTVSFDSGGRVTPTFVTNGFYIPRSYTDPARIGHITFNMAGTLVTLREAVALASAKCAEVRAAGLSPIHPGRTALISETMKRSAPRPVATEEELIAAFADQGTRAITAVPCDLQDSNQIFHVQIRNLRRSNNRLRGGGDESDVFGERTYQVRGDAGQNIDYLRARHQ